MEFLKAFKIFNVSNFMKVHFDFLKVQLIFIILLLSYCKYLIFYIYNEARLYL